VLEGEAGLLVVAVVQQTGQGQLLDPGGDRGLAVADGLLDLGGEVVLVLVLL
jgi:hypothetical protein